VHQPVRDSCLRLGRFFDLVRPAWYTEVVDYKAISPIRVFLTSPLQKALPDADYAQLRHISERLDLAFITVFGSAVSGTMTRESDLDMAVSMRQWKGDGSAAAQWYLTLVGELSEAIPHGEGLDVVVLNTAPSLLQFQVASHGILLYERIPHAWLRFRSYAARRYDDDSVFRKAQWEYLKRRYLP
jgi:predicted nucleotidyltransferase